MREACPKTRKKASSQRVVVLLLSSMEEITDRYTWNTKERSEEACRNHFLLPECVRGLLVGPSGCGKSTLMYTLLLKPGMLAYENLMVFGRSLFQIEYRIIKAAFEKGLSKEQIEVIFTNKAKVNKNGGPLETIVEYSGSCYGNITAKFYDSANEIPDPSELDRTRSNLILFDDCMEGPHSKIGSYYTRGRHSSTQTYFICQSYYKIPRQSIRLNTNFLILFRQSPRDTVQIFYDHVSMDRIELKTFQNDFAYATWDLGPHAFICIDLTRTKESGKYRRCLDVFYFPTPV